MRYALLPEQKKFFQHHGAIAFEQLWDEQQLTSVCDALDAVLAMRLGSTIPAIKRHSSQQRYLVGRDIWRGSTFLKKTVTNAALADLAAELFDKKPLRLAYDQYLPEWQPSTHYHSAEQSHYSDLLKRRLSLEEVSSVQGVIGGLLICLKTPIMGSESFPEELQWMTWPRRSGSGVFFKGSAPLDFRIITQWQGASYLLIVYCRDSSVYIVQNNDPQLHALKYIGYNFGDRLNDKLNPIVIR